MKYHAIAEKGKLNMGSEFMRENFRKFLLKNEGARIEFVPVLPESNNLRRFFEGAVVPLYTFFQQGLDYRDPEDLKNVREWLKIEHNGEFITVLGKAHKIAKSTKGGELKSFVERVIDDMGANGYPIEVLNPADYKKWRDSVFPFGGPDTYIDYLIETGKLNKKLR